MSFRFSIGKMCLQTATGKCPNYKTILAFSDLHISTSSTLPSLSCQSDLDARFIDDADDSMSPIRECTDDEQGGEDSGSY